MKTKRVLSFILAFAMILTTIASMGIVSVSADETETSTDFVLGDFSTGDTNGWYLGDAGSTTSRDIDMTNTLSESSASLKWTIGEGSYLYSPNFEGKMGNVINKKYINMWIYSPYVNTEDTQGCFLLLFDRTTGKAQNKKIALEWTGWKIVTWDISGLSAASFNGTKTANGETVTVNGADTDTVAFAMSIGRYGANDDDKEVYVKSDTTYYCIDKVWASDTNPIELGVTEDMSFSVADNATDVNFANKTYAFTADKLFKYGLGLHDDKVEVKAGNTTLANGSDYTIQQEHNKLYVNFKKKLMPETEYKFTLKSGVSFQDGYSTTTDYTYTFTTKADDNIFMIGDFSKPDGYTAAWSYLEERCHSQNDEVTMAGKELSLKWDKIAKTTTTDETTTTVAYSTRLMSPTISKINIEKALEYDKLGAWIYSDVANNQGMNIIFVDAKTGKAKQIEIKTDWTGWKLVSMDLSSYEYTGFSNENEDKIAATGDSWYVYYQCEGWKVNEWKADTLYYVDSIFLYNDEYFDTDYTFDGYMIADVSNADKGDAVSTSGSADGGWRNWTAGLEYDTTVKMNGSTSSLKWTTKQSYLWSPKFKGTELFDSTGTSKWKYLNVWICSNNAKNNDIRIGLCDMTNSKPYLQLQSGWSDGWKLLSIDISKLTPKSFNTASTVDCEYSFEITDGYGSINTSWGADDGDNTYYFDSIWLSNSNEEIVYNGVEADVANDAVVSSAKGYVGFEYPADLTVGRGTYDSSVTVKCGIEIVDSANYTVQQEGNMLYVIFDKGLDPAKTYTVSVAGIYAGTLKCSAVDLTFTTKEAYYDVDYSFGSRTMPENGSLTANAVVTNATDAATTARIILAVYDNEGNLVSASLGDPTEIGKGKTKTLTAADTQTSWSGLHAKAYVWQWDNLVPYTDAVGTIGK